MIIFGLIFGILTMVTHFAIVTFEILSRIPIVGFIFVALNFILILLRPLFAMLTDKFHPDGNMRAKIISLTTNMSEDMANEFVKNDIDTIEGKRQISKEAYLLKAIEQLKINTHPSVKLNFDNIDDILLIIGNLHYKQGMCTDPNNKQYICFNVSDITYGIYEIDNELGLIDFSKVNYEVKTIWL